MLRRLIVAIAAIAALGLSFSSIDASAAGHHHGGYGGGYHGGYHGGWHGGGGWGYGAGVLGGAILGGMLAAPYYYGPGPYYDYGYAYAPGYGGAAYCARRFRSYDARSGTYLGYDGYRHPCP